MNFLRHIEKGREYWVTRPAVAIDRRNFIMEVIKFELVKIEHNWIFQGCELVIECKINDKSETLVDPNFTYWETWWGKEKAFEVAKRNNKEILDEREAEFNRFKEMVNKYLI